MPLKTTPIDTSLADFLDRVEPLEQAIKDHIVAATKTIQVRRGGFLFKPGTEQRELYLIKQGVVRSYIVESGKEVTTWINEENEIVAPGRTFGLKLPSIEYLQAIEESTLARISYSEIEYLYEHYPIANKIGRILLEDNYRSAEERAFLARITSAPKRYQRFMELQPSLLKRVPLKYIASYLNMSMETLSRARSKRTPR